MSLTKHDLVKYPLCSNNEDINDHTSATNRSVGKHAFLGVIVADFRHSDLKYLISSVCTDEDLSLFFGI